ncbi:MAG: autotransporter-associated beta strand repeat-containing protein [Thermoguttaceae bacterium]|nr:autotransporter-associated beta strand repeat-containing protein [Thermoguttaceae bacterium]
MTSHSGFRLHKGTVSAVLGGTGDLWKESGDTFTLSRANTYTGDTLVNAGTLALSGAGSIHGSPAVHVAGGAAFDVSAVAGGVHSLASGQTLAGGGSVVGQLVVTDGSSLSPGASPGTLTHSGSQTWMGGGTYLWEINNPNAAAGADPGWDFLDISGTLTLDATEANPFVIDVISLTTDNVAGPLASFSSAVEYSWTLATAGDGIAGFAPELFDVRLDHFANDWGGRWQVGLAGNSLVLNYIPEPSTFVLAAMGMLAAAFFRRNRR